MHCENGICLLLKKVMIIQFDWAEAVKLEQRQSLEFESEGMRLIFTMLLAVILSAVFCNSTAQDPNNAGGRPTQISEDKNSEHLKGVQKCTPTFKEFKAKYNKQYASVAEQKYRQYIFYINLKILNNHNRNPNRTFNMKPNSFLDIQNNEFREVYTNTYHSNTRSWNISNQFIRKDKEKSADTNNNSIIGAEQPTNENLSEPPDFLQEEIEQNISNSQSNQQSKPIKSRVLQEVKNIQAEKKQVDIDWTLYSGKVKFQGTCGACYAFSAVDTVATLNNIHNYGFFVPLSVQQVVDCSLNGLTYGCRGGYLEGAYTYIQVKGITLQSIYPYTYVNTSLAGKCKIQGGAFKISSFTPLQEGNCNALVDELAYGPVSVGISGYNLQYYGEGIFNECSKELDHAVMVVGFKSGVGWRIKNSWGTDWGQNGYGWIAQGNTCGICNMAVSVRL